MYQILTFGDDFDDFTSIFVCLLM